MTSNTFHFLLQLISYYYSQYSCNVTAPSFYDKTEVHGLSGTPFK